MTGYVVLPPGHVTLACLHVLPSEVPENVRTLGLYRRIINEKIEFMGILMKEILVRPIKTGATLAADLNMCMLDHSQNQKLESPCFA